jgi:hypothetical protein
MTHCNDPRACGAAGPIAVPARSVTRSGRRRVPAALIAAAIGATLSVGASPAAAATAAEPAEVLHYRLQISQPGSHKNPAQDLSLMDVWQAGDGSRVRARLERDFTSSAAKPSLVGYERVVTRTVSRTYVPGEDRIIVYRRAMWLPAPAAYDIPAQIGDPRTLPDRAQDGDGRVKALGEATVNGVPVLRFRLGTCRVARPAHRRAPSRQADTTIMRVNVVSIHRDTHVPVRVEQPPCRTWRPRARGMRLDKRSGMSFDYLQFESVPATEAALQLLEMSPHHGAVEVDGAALDAAEEAAEQPAARPVVIGSRRVARSGGSVLGRLQRSHARRGLRSAR